MRELLWLHGFNFVLTKNFFMYNIRIRHNAKEQAIRHSDYVELLSKFIMNDISIEGILSGNKYGIYFDYWEIKFEEGYKESVEKTR